MTDLKKTPLNHYYRESNVKLVDFGGWELPIQFSSIKEEHNAVRTHVGMFEVSHMGEIQVSGNDAEAFLNYCLTNDVTKLSETKAQYTFLCNHDGGVIDDLIIYKLEAQNYLLVVNAGNTDIDFEWLLSVPGYDVKIENISSNYGQIAVQGPDARELIQSVVEIDLTNMKLFNFKQNINIKNKMVLLSQSGYTGEDGFEIYCDSKDTLELWQLFKQNGAQECGLGARDTLRLEAGLPLHGQDLSETITPVEAKFGFAVKLKKGEFIGSEILNRQKENGTKRRLAGFKLLSKGIARTEYEAFSKNGDKVGEVTSGTLSPYTGHSIGFVLIDSKFYEENQTFVIQIRNKEVEAQFVQAPFYKE